MDIELVTDISQCRPTVQNAAVALENHLRENADKPSVRQTYGLMHWFTDKISPGSEALWTAITSKDPVEIKRRTINLFTRAYFAGVLAEMWGPGE